MSLKQNTLKKLEFNAKRYTEIENSLASSDISSDPEKLKDLAKEFNSLEPSKRLHDRFHKLETELENCKENISSETDDEMKILYRDEIDSIETQIEHLSKEIEELFNPAQTVENRPVIVEIRQGTGGNEAAIFAGDLFNMYIKYSESKNWKYEIISSAPSALGGFKEIIFSIKGDGAFNLLQFESGVHRVQRVPITEAGGRIHTSASTVAILIEPDEVEVNIDPNDIEVDTFRASGAGGQHVNKTDSAIRITHRPTGITVECQDERSQHQNRAKAMRLLRARLLVKFQEEQQQQIAADRKNQVGSGDRSERIRTYNFPQNRVSDHRVNLTLYKLETIIAGEMDPLLEPLVEQIKEQESELQESE
ncbi:MAG TPA: peptide chain release factor 1 [bacterium]|nr:peptide chain release factor 1 [bacterium]